MNNLEYFRSLDYFECKTIIINKKNTKTHFLFKKLINNAVLLSI